MIPSPSTPNRLASTLLVVFIVLSSGCMGFFGSSGTNAGELTIFNEDDEDHEVVIRGVNNGEITQSLPANSSQTITLVESPGEYAINATIDGTTSVNTTIDYSPGGESGDQLAGPGLILTIREGGEAYFSQSYD